MKVREATSVRGIDGNNQNENILVSIIIIFLISYGKRVVDCPAQVLVFHDKYQTNQGNRLETEIMKARGAAPVGGIDGNNENENIISIIILILIMERD